jgi:hypothetical protein
MRQACEESVGKAGWFMVGSEMAEIGKEHARSLSGMLSRKSGRVPKKEAICCKLVLCITVRQA